MVVIGGKNYRWRGNNTRVIGENSITLPRKDSFIISDIGLMPDYKYTIAISGCNKGGDGRLTISIDNVLSKDLYIKSKNFTDHKIIFDTSNIAINTKATLKIARTNNSSGNIVIDSITILEDKIPVKITEQSPEEIIKEEKLQRQREFGQLQLIKDSQERERKTKAALIARGDIMGTTVRVGGSSYKWQGHGVKTIYKFNTVCGVLAKPKATLMVPANIEPDSRYKITIEAAADRLPNKILINFFGNLENDGPQISVDIMSNNIKRYEIYAKTPNFPDHLSMYLRVFTGSGFTGGNIYIKNVEYTQVMSTETQPLPKAKLKSVPKSINKKIASTPQNIQGLEDMKFKPVVKRDYKEEIKHVYIQSADQVPKVSIITPTRDGLDLIKECYKAINDNTAYPNWEWIIGDSKSTDGTVEYFQSLKDDRIKFIARDTTEGSFSSINNELVKQATGEYLLFLNNDTAPQKYWLYEMMSKIRHNSQIGIVGARLMYNSERVQHAGIMFIPPGPANVGKDLLKLVPGGFELEDRYYQAVTGACLLISKKDFEAVGGFDPIYHFCYEDVDLCLKVKDQLNKKILYAANAVVYHRESVTQKKYGTGGEKQREGIKVFKQRWMRRHDIVDVHKYSGGNKHNLYPVQISFVTCINNLQQYNSYVVGSLFNNKTNKNYEIIPVLNFNNPYSAAQALNIGMAKARGNIVVLCHQDVMFFQDWIEMLFARISEIEQTDKNWGIIGTAGIDTSDNTMGVVYNMGGSLEWRSTVKGTHNIMQTLDEHCLILRKNSQLKFDEKLFDGFHFYGADICLNAMSKGMKNYGILCPLVHNSGSSGSLRSGQKEFMKFLNALAKKWKNRFRSIRTPTSVIKQNAIKTFIKFTKG